MSYFPAETAFFAAPAIRFGSLLLLQLRPLQICPHWSGRLRGWTRLLRHEILRALIRHCLLYRLRSLW